MPSTWSTPTARPPRPNGSRRDPSPASSWSRPPRSARWPRPWRRGTASSWSTRRRATSASCGPPSTRADALVIPTRAGGVEPNRVVATLEMTPANIPAGVVICSARLGTRDLEATVEWWAELEVPVWGIIPERVSIASGPAARLSSEGLELYGQVLRRPWASAAERSGRGDALHQGRDGSGSRPTASAACPAAGRSARTGTTGGRPRWPARPAG